MVADASEGGSAERVFFMHIMKTAGTTLAKQLAPVFPADVTYPDAPPGPDRAAQYWKISEVTALDPAHLARLRFVHGHLPLLVADLVQADQVITILRDPVDRVISHLRHIRRYKMPDRPLEEVYENPWFHSVFFVNYQVKQFAFRPSDQAECHMDVLTIDEERFAFASDNLDRIDVLGFIDRYDAFTGELARRYGWALPPEQRREVAPERPEISPSLRARIEADNEADVAFYHEARQRRAAL